MFNLQGSELIIILLLALVVLGPEKLPDAMRKAGQFYAELKKMSTGFQNEFRAAVDEPLREIRNTANVLRDSADFTKLQSGDRDEKPKSADMMSPADAASIPSDETPTFEAPGDASSPDLADDSKPAPFTDDSSAAPAAQIQSRQEIRVPPPFTGMSSAAPRPPEPPIESDAEGDADPQDGADDAPSEVSPGDDPVAPAQPDEHAASGTVETSERDR